MKNSELIKGQWYFTSSDMYIKFDCLKSGDVWVSEYISASGQYYKSSGCTSSIIKRKATAADFEKYPEMGTFNSEINNYEIY